MAAISNVAKSSVSLGWTREQCTQKNVDALVLKTFRRIVEESNKWRSSYKTDKSLLEKNFWYPLEYYQALKEVSAITRLKWLKDNGSFYHGYAPKNFSSISDASKKSATGKSLFAYKLENGPASEAIKNIRDRVFFFDCQEAIQLAQYESLLEILGDKNFDVLFDPKGKAPLAFNPTTALTPIGQFIERKPISAIEEGNEVFFNNVPFYEVKQPHGESRGFHAVCVQKNPPKFIAFGISEEGLTESQMYDFLVKEFNKEPVQGTQILTEQHQDKARTIFLAVPGAAQMEQVAKSYVLTRAEFDKTRYQAPDKVGLNPIGACISAVKIATLLAR